MMQKTYNRKYEASPIFRFSTGDLATGNKKLIDFEQEKPSSKKYLPFNNLNIQNTSSSKILVTINQDEQRTYILQPSTVINFDENIIPAVNYISITNIGTSTITDGDINITVYKEAITQDTVIQSIHKKLFDRNFRSNLI